MLGLRVHGKPLLRACSRTSTNHTVRKKLVHSPTLTRAPIVHRGRFTTVVASGALAADLGLPH